MEPKQPLNKLHRHYLLIGNRYTSFTVSLEKFLGFIFKRAITLGDGAIISPQAILLEGLNLTVDTILILYF